MFCSGTNIKDITLKLKQLGIKNSSNKYFCYNSISNMLKNKKYIGTFIYNNIEYENYCPSIIEKEQFEKVQKMLKSNKYKPGAYKAKTNYLLSGKVYCGECGSSMVGETGTSKLNKVYNYYKCNGKKKFHNCDKTTVTKQWLEDLVIEATYKHIFHSETYNIIIDNIVKVYNNEFDEDNILKLLKSNKEKTQNEINNLINCLKNGINSKSITDELTNLENELESITLEIAKYEAINKNKITREQIEFMFEQFRNEDYSNESMRERLIDTFVHKVILYNDKIRIIYNHTGDKNFDEIKKSESTEISGTSVGSDLSNLVEVLGFEPRSKKRNITTSSCASLLFCFTPTIK